MKIADISKLESHFNQNPFETDYGYDMVYNNPQITEPFLGGIVDAVTSGTQAVSDTVKTTVKFVDPCDDDRAKAPGLKSPSISSLANQTTFQSDTGCVAKLTSIKNHEDKVLKNVSNEWTGAGRGDGCTSCVGKNGFDCGGGICGTFGNRVKIKRKSGSAGYTAKDSDCCLSNNTVFGEKTCHPDTRQGNRNSNERCNIPLENYCKVGSRIFTDDKCKEWKRNGTSTGKSKAGILEEIFCSENVKDGKCEIWGNEAGNLTKRNQHLRSFCSNTNNLKTPFCQDKMKKIGGVDSLVSGFCRSNPDSPFCACSVSAQPPLPANADRDLAQVVSRPDCYNTTCITNGYLFENQDPSNCPNLLICKNTLTAAGIDDSTLQNIDQSCQQDADVSSPAGRPSTTTEKKDGNFLDSLSDAQFNFLMFFILILVASIIGIAVSSLIPDDTPNMQSEKST